jgi:hypothetical protein
MMPRQSPGLRARRNATHVWYAPRSSHDGRRCTVQ